MTNRGVDMAVLHIEHSISDLDVWLSAFAEFADRRRAAGVRHERVCRPIDDPHYVVVDLDFDQTEQAEAFLGFLHQAVWSTPANSPALVGRPTGRVLGVEHDTSS
jgi:hypothetical protein